MPTPADSLRGFSSNTYASLGRKLEVQLFDEVCSAAILKPKLTLSKAAAFVLAGSVHGLTLALAAGGILLFVDFPGQFTMMILGGLCLLVAWFVRPRLGKRPSGLLQRSQAPNLYRFVEEVCEHVASGRIDGIVLTPVFNASVKRIGVRRRVYMEIGVPLFVILTPQERVALLAHEVGHLVNGDPLRGVFVDSALNTLQTWHSILIPGHPPRRLRAWRARPWLSDSINRVVGGILSAIVRGYGAILIRFTYRASQRAEYLADGISRRVAGSDAAASMLRKLPFGSLFSQVVQSTALNNETELIGDFRKRVLVPGVETPEPDAAFRLDSAHPSTKLRIEFVASKTIPAGMALTQGESEEIDRELLPFQAGLERRMQDEYRAKIYR